jgi:VIT1/CCC1 family predicted Fe2+/Mn2+ transporter
MLLVPFFISDNSHIALLFSFAIAVMMIFLCNFCIRRAHNRKWWRHAIEMLIICVTVSIVAFLIGEFAKSTMGVII